MFVDGNGRVLNLRYSPCIFNYEQFKSVAIAGIMKLQLYAS
jgi:hypothetical protein